MSANLKTVTAAGVLICPDGTLAKMGAIELPPLSRGNQDAQHKRACRVLLRSVRGSLAKLGLQGYEILIEGSHGESRLNLTEAKAIARVEAGL